ncbi:MAG: hypothetical protein GY854_13500 [Deltaproteobacteria bacterium]|nr:hypothetical protein [Deltaproteobacteria bacterium]
MRSLRLTSCVIACLLVTAFEIRADEKSEDQAVRERAKEYFERGEILYDAGEYSKAAQAFILAYELAPHPLVLANIAMAYDRAGKATRAVEAYDEYLSVNEDKKAETRRDILLKTIGEISADCPDASCQIKISSLGRGDAPTKAYVNPGSHTVEAFVNGELVASSEVQVEAGEISRVELSIEVEEQEKVENVVVPNEPLEKPEEDRIEIFNLGLGFWISSGVTVVSGAVTIAFGARTLRDEKEYIASGRLDSKIQKQGEKDRLATNVMIGVTAAAAAVAAGFAINDLFFGAPAEEAGKDEENRISVMPGPGLGVGVLGSF